MAPGGRPPGADRGARGGGTPAARLTGRPASFTGAGQAGSMWTVVCSLRLIEDRLPPGAGYDGPLPALARVIYVTAGSLDLIPGPVGLSPGTAWHGAGGPEARAGAAGAHVLRFELFGQPPPTTSAGRLVLEHPLALARPRQGVRPADDRARREGGGRDWLMRCDRVEFEPGGVALPHRHRGGGIRRLLAGRLQVTVGDGAPRAMHPGDAWFESGREPVLAVAAPDEATSFIRVSVLPAEIRGQSSIVYVDPADAGRSRPRRYTVHIDEPIDLPGGGARRAAASR